jgi:transposase InsO family protein
LSLHLGWSKNKTRRIRTIANIAVPTTAKRYKYPRANKAKITAPPNILHNYTTLKNINKPQDGLDYSNMANAEAWVQDFTYIKHSGSFCYLAIVMSIKTREVIGWRLGTNHTSELTHSALLDALGTVNNYV